MRHVLHLALDRVDLREEAGELLREALPVLAHHDMASRAQEEIEPRLFLERLHRLAQRRLRDMQLRSGVRDVLQAADREEITHLEQGHGTIPFVGCQQRQARARRVRQEIWLEEMPDRRQSRTIARCGSDFRPSPSASDRSSCSYCSMEVRFVAWKCAAIHRFFR